MKIVLIAIACFTVGVVVGRLTGIISAVLAEHGDDEEHRD